MHHEFIPTHFLTHIFPAIPFILTLLFVCIILYRSPSVYLMYLVYIPLTVVTPYRLGLNMYIYIGYKLCNEHLSLDSNSWLS